LGKKVEQLIFTSDTRSIAEFYEKCGNAPRVEISFRYKTRGMTDEDLQRLKDKLRGAERAGHGHVCVQLACKGAPDGSTENLLKLIFLTPAIELLGEQKFSSRVIVL
jgi:hypothetical protein